MSEKEVSRFDIISRLKRKEINGSQAAKILSLSTRQVRRLKKRVTKKRGARGLIHKSRGKPGNRRIPMKEEKKITRLLHAHYVDFTPTFAAEKLSELHDVNRDPKTIRRIMIEAKLLTPASPRRKESHRAWRARKDSEGEMEQYDGSYHDWFEGRGGISEACLLASIDDATGTITRAEFAPHEGVFPTFAFWRGYLLKKGKPRSIYLDKFSTYTMSQKAAKENHETKTQFERAMRELGIEPISAHSPQAKGRIERLFETLQDRLVKELRLAGISTVPEANRFLEEVFIPDFNKKFAVVPKSEADLHRPLTKAEEENLDAVFSRQEMRTVRNDFTLSFKNQWHQITTAQSVTVRKGDRIIVEERLDGTIRMRLRGKYLNVTALPERPKKANVPWIIAKTAAPETPHKPAADHPWRSKIFAGKNLFPSSN